MRSGIAGVSFSITDRISLVADNPAIENADRITINRLQHDMAGAPGTGSWAYIVGTYDKDVGANNQRLYLNATRVAQMSDTLPIELNSAALGIGRHVSGIADPFNGHIDEFRISRVRRSGDLERRNGVAAEAERRATCLRMASGTGAAQIRPSAARPVRDPP
jgi:Concanavalin A-like lectin/glucanases superfamily